MTPRSTTSRRSSAPTLRVERSLMAEGHRLIAAVDEVGRGAIAGPVSVGVVVIDATVSRSLRGVRDSKLLGPEEREALVGRIHDWAVDCAVGHAEAAEIDALGLTAALGVAGRRALGQLSVAADVVLLDGNHDWLSGRHQQRGLLDGDVDDTDGLRVPPVRTMIKADLRCSSVAAASVLAKVRRDRLMADHAVGYPGFGWEINKGYGTPAHRARLRLTGPTPLHRRTWRLFQEQPDDRGEATGPSGPSRGGSAVEAVPLLDPEPPRGASPPAVEA